MKLFKRTISLAIALIMIISLIPSNIVIAAVGDSESNPILYNKSDTTNFPESPNEGYVLPIKTAEWVANEDNVAKITMSLQGKGVQKKTDVVLVIDRSGSMNNTINVLYNEIPVTFTATDVRYQYNNKSTGNTWIWNTSKTATISMTAYIDDSDAFSGYKYDTLKVTGLDVTNAKRYRINTNKGDFNSWTSLSDDDCANALLSIFSGKQASAVIDGQSSNITFPTDIYTFTNTVNYTNGTKIISAKAAAKKFVSALLATDKMKTLNRIGVVSYSSSDYGKGEVYVDSAISNNNSSLNTAIEGIEATGGTNIQAGIAKAQELLSSSNAANKYIVVLSDGEPTFSYMATTATASMSDDFALNYPSNLGYKLTNFNTTVLGSGGDYEYYTYWRDYRYYINGSLVTNNGIPTISQALLAKKAGIEIYSVGFDVTGNDNAIYTMKHVASSVDNFYLATDDLSGVFTNIAGKIAKAGTNAKVNSAMGEDTQLGYNFTVIKDSSHPVTASQGNAVVSTDLKSISWDLGTSNTGGDITETPAVLTYYIKLNVTGGKTIDKNAILNTGNTSSVVYKNYLGLWCKKDFPPSALTAGNGMLNVSYYLSDKAGNPINSNGVIIPFKDRVFINDSLNQAVLLSTSIKVSDYAKSIVGYINQSTIAKNENGVNFADSIIATRATVYLNFPYIIQPTYNVLYSGNGSTGGTAPTDNNKYKEADTVNVLDKGTLVKTGFSFKGWSTTNNGSVTYTDGSNFKMPTNDITLYAVWENSQYNLKINYIYDGGATFDTYTAELNVNQTYNVPSPVKNGWTADNLIVSGIMPDRDVTVTVYYKRNFNKLINNTMYPSKGINPISTVKTSFDIVENFDYTFGFKFVAGQDAPNFNLSLSNDPHGKYKIDNFKLYEGNTVVSAGATFSSLDKTKIKTGNTYTVTYSLKCKESNANLTIEVTMDYLMSVGVVNPISISSKMMPVLE